MPERPLLTAQRRNLLLLNFPVPAEVIERLAPPGTEPETYKGETFVSIVGFHFVKTRLCGLPFPGHTNFPEINLRYYVRRIIGNEVRRGVVFAREIAPRRAVALIANRLFNENYITRKMRSNHHIENVELSPGDTIEYAWKTATERFGIPLPPREACGEPRRTGQGEGSFAHSQKHHWNRLAARVAAPLALPQHGSPEEFFVENYWGYVRGRDGKAREYRVEHASWRVAPVDNVIWDCDVAASYDSPFAEFLATRPTSGLIAEGSPIQLYRGRTL